MLHERVCNRILADADPHLLAESIGELLVPHPQSSDDVHVRALDPYVVGVHLSRLSKVLKGAVERVVIGGLRTVCEN